MHVTEQVTLGMVRESSENIPEYRVPGDFPSLVFDPFGPNGPRFRLSPEWGWRLCHILPFMVSYPLFFGVVVMEPELFAESPAVVWTALAFLAGKPLICWATLLGLKSPARLLANTSKDYFMYCVVVLRVALFLTIAFSLRASVAPFIFPLYLLRLLAKDPGLTPNREKAILAVIEKISYLLVPIVGPSRALVYSKRAIAIGIFVAILCFMCYFKTLNALLQEIPLLYPKLKEMRIVIRACLYGAGPLLACYCFSAIEQDCFDGRSARGRLLEQTIKGRLRGSFFEGTWSQIRRVTLLVLGFDTLPGW
eukprot:CAMPEP_0172606712 /NCGR_PEP_ID=MMETSP1068-20121228/26917_1 /TAXON_ID=35684 /ORGANISM="Pseudopedinella elastica, Strain CCMP716" /LENGTH=307 /DNA_ID=CAMNT_0013409519 /DNA_START=573 /DNA_END=1493 /DNA_ORIENTATION=+